MLWQLHFPKHTFFFCVLTPTFLLGKCPFLFFLPVEIQPFSRPISNFMSLINVLLFSCFLFTTRICCHIIFCLLVPYLRRCTPLMILQWTTMEERFTLFSPEKSYVFTYKEFYTEFTKENLLRFLKIKCFRYLIHHFPP